jgi:hypothetical protein
VAVVWLQTQDGRMIHFPVVGPTDINSPDDPIKIPSGIVAAPNRALVGQITISSPTHGQITLDFDVPGRVGTCIQCGQCCVHPVANCPKPPDLCGYILDTQYNVHKCQYLSISPGANKLGKSGGTECSIYSNLSDSFKGCIHGPQIPEDIWAWMTSCGYSFGG